MIARYGGAAIFLVSFLENIGLPFPAFPFLMLGGAFSVSGIVSFPLVVAGAVAGALGADMIWYVVGKWRGRGILVTLCRMSFNPDVCVESAVDQFHRRKTATILFAKFLPGVNTIMPPLAGVASVPPHRFLAADLIGHYRAPRIGADELYRRQSEPEPPLVLDLRRDDDYERSERMIEGSYRLRPATFHRFAHHLPADRDLVFYCT